jgi:hypothetical protein
MTLPPDFDIFSPGRDALAKARALFGGRALFVPARRLQADGSWLGPPRAACSLVDEDVLCARGGLSVVREAGVNTVLCDLDGTLATQTIASGLRCLVRVPFTDGEEADQRRRRLGELTQLLNLCPRIDGVMPTPTAAAQGLDTLVFFAACRQAAGQVHLVVDLAALGHRLGQLCLSFGADEILGSIVARRELRLGEHASSNDITRDEAALLLRASGFLPCERLPDGRVLLL